MNHVAPKTPPGPRLEKRPDERRVDLHAGRASTPDETSSWRAPRRANRLGGVFRASARRRASTAPAQRRPAIRLQSKASRTRVAARQVRALRRLGIDQQLVGDASKSRSARDRRPSRCPRLHHRQAVARLDLGHAPGVSAVKLQHVERHLAGQRRERRRRHSPSAPPSPRRRAPRAPARGRCRGRRSGAICRRTRSPRRPRPPRRGRATSGRRQPADLHPGQAWSVSGAWARRAGRARRRRQHFGPRPRLRSRTSRSSFSRSRRSRAAVGAVACASRSHSQTKPIRMPAMMATKMTRRAAASREESPAGPQGPGSSDTVTGSAVGERHDHEDDGDEWRETAAQIDIRPSRSAGHAAACRS